MKPNIEDQQALEKITAWRDLLLVAYDSECCDGVSDVVETVSEVTKFAHELFSNIVPKELDKLKKILDDTGFNTVNSVQDPYSQRGIALKLVVELDLLLDTWYTKIKTIGLPRPTIETPEKKSVFKFFRKAD